MARRSRARCASPTAATAAPRHGTGFSTTAAGKPTWIVRMKWNSFHLTGQDGAPFDLIDHLATLPNDQVPHEINVQALVRRGVTIPVRLIILRKTPQATEAARKA